MSQLVCVKGFIDGSKFSNREPTMLWRRKVGEFYGIKMA